jgi:hypothetical protein
LEKLLREVLLRQALKDRASEMPVAPYRMDTSGFQMQAKVFWGYP